jgi:hypothetical protein
LGCIALRQFGQLDEAFLFFANFLLFAFFPVSKLEEWLSVQIVLVAIVNKEVLDGHLQVK